VNAYKKMNLMNNSDLKISNSKPKNRSSLGFTLIELLVVIAIIAVLLAILFPVLRKVKAITKRLGCQSNLKQLALAWNAYLHENDGRFYQNVNASVTYGGWKGKNPTLADFQHCPRVLNRNCNLPRELENPNDAKVFCCPADRGGVPGPGLRKKAFVYIGTSYRTNDFLIGPDQVQVPRNQFQTLHQEINKRLPNININQVGNHSRLLLIGDYGWVNQFLSIPLPEQWKELAEWHGRIDSHNIAFLDGHCSFLTIPKGIYHVPEEYTVVPFQELYNLAIEAQNQ